MLKKWSLILSLTMVMFLLFSAVASAFDDLNEDSDRDQIHSLQKRGIVSGYGNSFMGNKKMINAEGVYLIVKATDLNLDTFRFIKEPLASDSFDNVPNDAWYANAFIIASINGLQLQRAIDPEADMTREAFAHHLLTAMLVKGEYPFTEALYVIQDDADIRPDYKNSIQKLLNAKIITLDKNGKFHPQIAITRRDAAVMVYQALEFMNSRVIPVPGNEDPHARDPINTSITKVNDEVQKVVLSWGEKPNGGYTLAITKIVFAADGKAEIHYKLHFPDKDKMYAQVITTPQTETFLSAKYPVPVLVEDK